MVVDGSGSTVGSSGAGGAGGASTTTSSDVATSTGTVHAVTSTATSTTTGAGGGTCVSTIQLVADNGAPVELTSICAGATYNPSNSTVPIGYLFQGGPPPGESNLTLLGCVSDAPGAEGIQLFTDDVFGPGTFYGGTATYTDAMGTASTSTSNYEVTIMTLGPLGQAIEGTFAATTQTQGPAIIVHFLSGSFHICHVEDEDAP